MVKKKNIKMPIKTGIEKTAIYKRKPKVLLLKISIIGRIRKIP